MRLLLQLASRISSRFALWTPAVLAVSLIRPSKRLDADTRLRFSYACLMGRDRPRVRNAFAHLLRRELNVSAANNLWLAHTAWGLGCFQLARLIQRKTAKIFPNTSEAIIARREEIFSTRLLDGSMEKRLANGVGESCNSKSKESLATGEPWIVVPFSSRYDDLFQLWRQQLVCHAKGRLIVLAMDEMAAKIARAGDTCDIIDLSEYFAFDDTGQVENYSKRHLWILRVLVLRELIYRGQNVISLDLDAVLVGNLTSMLLTMQEADIVAQRDYSIPVDVARKLGFILCCGFLRIRANPATTNLMQRYARQTLLEMDDQTALNHLLEESGVQNRRTTESYLAFDAAGVSWACPDAALVSRDVNTGSVLRHFHQQGLNIEELKLRLGIGTMQKISR